MRTHPVIASYHAPKQRMTIHYSIGLVHNTAGDTYTVIKTNKETGEIVYQDPFLTKEEGWTKFKSMVLTAMEYGTGTWEE